MIISQTGPIAGGFHMLGDPGVPVFLLEGDRPLIFDAGFSCMGPVYVEAVRGILNGTPPAFLFLTHSHFDHCGSAAFLAQSWPGLEVCCSPQAKSVFERPGALEVIRNLSHAAGEMLEQFTGSKPSEVAFEPFEVARTLSGGDVLRVSPSVTVQVIETPGHTRDCLSYYIPEKKALVASEAAGIPNKDGYIICDFLVDYDMYTASLEKLMGLPLEILVLGHGSVLTGEDARSHLPRAMEQCVRFKDWVLELLDGCKGDAQKVMAQVRKKEYDNEPFPKQPEPAYLLNLEARVRAVNKIRRRT